MRDGYKAIKNTHRKWKVKHDMRKSIKYNIIMGLFESPLVVNAVISHAFKKKTGRATLYCIYVS